MSGPEMGGDTALACVWRPSPNFRPRKAPEQVRCVVVHGTWMNDDEAALARLTDPAAEVSCHYYIARDGRLTQLVREADVAWHAGASRWYDPELGVLEGLNAWSLGIEIGNVGPFGARPPTPEDEREGRQWAGAEVEAYTAEQYATLRALLADVQVRHPILNRARVVGHSAVSPGRKSDPGAHFDWAKVWGG